MVRDHTVINAGAGCASFRRTDDAEVGAAIELGAKAPCKREAASSRRDQSGGQIKRGGDRIAPAPPRQCGRVDRRFFMESREGGFLKFVEGWGSRSVYDTPIVRSNDFGHRPSLGCRILLSCTATSAAAVWR